MQASAFERLRHELILEVVPSPPDGHALVAGDAGQAHCLRAKYAEHLKQLSLTMVVHKNKWGDGGGPCPLRPERRVPG